MFYHIAGEYVHAEESFVVLDCGGVGYKLTVSRTTAAALGHPSTAMGKVKLYTDLQVREDGVELFGFYTEEELDTFRMLIAVSGVGPKAALAILSLFTPDRLALAVAAEDTKAIARANGVGPKTAARVVLELRDKFKGLPSSVGSAVHSGTAPGFGGASTSGGKLSEAVEALTVLGYNRTEVMAALQKVDTATMTVEQMITTALKYFAK
ncbi:MAG: Holliday junction branch migration protein RuvA [Clostridia bacterium]|nr:Holliday junction branch migration protein RuvA [Clostridia bacterium]